MNKNTRSEDIQNECRTSGILNCRDLAGMKTADGRRIIPGKLLRSGHPGKVAGNTLTWLSDNVDIIINFRGEKESAERPEPVISGIRVIHLPIIDSFAAGMTRDRGSD